MKKFTDFKELKEGDCKVILSNSMGVKEVEGKFNSKLGVLFFCLTNRDEVIGYRQ